MMAVDSLTFILGRKLSGFPFVLVVNLWLNLVSMIFKSVGSGKVAFCEVSPFHNLFRDFCNVTYNQADHQRT